MKRLSKVLTDKLLKDIRVEVTDLHAHHAWQASFAWTPGLTKGFSGCCLSAEIYGQIKERILVEIGSFLPKCEEYILQYYVWQQHSGIAVHDDSGKVFGATIYLNDTWQPENGGIFLYKEKESSASAHEWSALIPNNNTMVVNDNHEQHMVTLLSPYSTDFRYTIQIWGTNGEENEH